MALTSPLTLFHVDPLSMVMVGLVSFVALCIVFFAYRYLDGDNKQKAFFLRLSLLVTSVFIMVCADNLLLFFASLASSNALLVKLMIHKPSWRAAKASGVLTAKHLIFSQVCIALSFLVLYYSTGLTSIQAIIHNNFDLTTLTLTISLLFLGAIAQSALWPFHKWLTSSLNSPTPVSALMHAGLINCGGFILTRFASLLSGHPDMLTVIFVTGFVTAITGTLWKLLQADVKRMLASSTMAQMGFMFMQCGLGLFPAAIAHLCWHGFFKAYLFLASSSVAQDKKHTLTKTFTPKSFIFSLGCGAVSAYAFALASHKDVLSLDANLFLVVIALIAGTQLSLNMLQNFKMRTWVLTLGICSVLGCFYGISVHFLESLLSPAKIYFPQSLNIFHLISLGTFAITWLLMIYYEHQQSKSESSKLFASLYVKALNASQPHASTVTGFRNHYQYQ